ncbi:MAG: type II toxin-antitoxin system RelE/ParE family toxin [Bacteroidia bacterium]|nr:type II toxin-antitoxin system RelE/ParE family toxin [Bacteroidia bacterium]
MTKFVLEYSLAAEKDIEHLTNTILYRYKAPMTAFKYVQGLLTVINALKINAPVFLIQTNEKLCARYGDSVRRVNFKKMTVLYSIRDSTVFIHRIVPQSTIIL